MGRVLMTFIFISLVIYFIVVPLWYAEQIISYQFRYRDQVMLTVCQMVKPEHLKHPEMCTDILK